jgi:hypothetical protein
MSVANLQPHIARTIGTDTSKWTPWGDGWDGEAEAAFVDAILSGQARYGNSPKTGVRQKVGNWRRFRQQGLTLPVVLDDLRQLADWTSQARAWRLADKILDNRQTLRGRGANRPLKALGISQAARAFVHLGITSAAQISDSQVQKDAWCSVEGVGRETWHYMLMLLGKPDVKVDTMISRFMENAFGSPVGSKQARKLVKDAAKTYGVTATELDHAIWAWQRKRP